MLGHTPFPCLLCISENLLVVPEILRTAIIIVNHAGKAPQLLGIGRYSRIAKHHHVI